MITMTRLVQAAIVLAGFVPAAGYALAGRWLESLLCALAGAGWLVAARSSLGWPADAGFLLLVGLCGFGAISLIPPGWALAGTLAALAAWDLSAFAGRVAAAGHVVDEDALWRAHLRRLAAVLVTGLVLGAAALIIPLDLGFGTALLLGLVAVVALSRAVASFRER